jgi:hypothetical protein
LRARFTNHPFVIIFTRVMAQLSLNSSHIESYGRHGVEKCFGVGRQIQENAVSK